MDIQIHIKGECETNAVSEFSHDNKNITTTITVVQDVSDRPANIFDLIGPPIITHTRGVKCSKVTLPAATA